MGHGRFCIGAFGHGGGGFVQYEYAVIRRSNPIPYKAVRTLA